jgi:hypothetical protein
MVGLATKGRWVLKLSYTSEPGKRISPDVLGACSARKRSEVTSNIELRTVLTIAH